MTGSPSLLDAPKLFEFELCLQLEWFQPSSFEVTPGMSPSPWHVNTVWRVLVVTVSCVTLTGCLSQVPSALSMNRSVDSWGFSPRVLRRGPEKPGISPLWAQFLPSLVCEVLNLFCLYLSRCVRAVRQSGVLCVSAGYIHRPYGCIGACVVPDLRSQVPGVPYQPNRKEQGSNR